MANQRTEQQIREEEVKNRLARDYFQDFDCTKILGDVDFCVTLKPINKNQLELQTESLLWAEAKKGKADFATSIVQLILTVGKARTFDTHLPPAYLGSFDTEKITFIPYNEIHDVFYVNDFNWNVAPSNYDTKEFKQLYERVIENIEKYSFVFFFGKDDDDIEEFIKTNFILGKSSTSKVRIDKNNFIVIYTKWLTSVKPTIAVKWDVAKKIGIIDGDFYLADLLSHENETLKQNLSVILKKNHYELERSADDMGMFQSKTTVFMDKQAAHYQFWNKYERPPKEEYWDYIIERRDLLVPQDIRERKGSFFTPQIWVELSQKYLTDTLGENWQDEYYIWDCAAGTGNLLTGLTNKLNIFASTLDKQDVDVIHERIETMNANSVSGQGSNLLKSNVFQFDFLNDSFDKLPKPLLNIINDPEKRKKLVIYINPPYAEAANYGNSKEGVSSTKVYHQFKNIVSFAASELFSQFFVRVFHELPTSKLASFSTLKFVSSQNFAKFRQYFKAEYKKGFVVRANTFDNVKGNFPIGFLIFDLNNEKEIKEVECDVVNNNGKIEQTKLFSSIKKAETINNWLRLFYDENEINSVGYLRFVGPNFQVNRSVFFTSEPKESDIRESRIRIISLQNLLVMCIYLTVRQVFNATWLNDRDQFLFPNNKWEKDKEFQNDCLTFALFDGQNKIKSEKGTNHWIPFKEQEVNSNEVFNSNFMTDFLSGKIKKQNGNHLFDENQKPIKTPLEFSKESKDVFDTGRELWKYYHTTINTTQFFLDDKPNCNASLYDIRAYFQGRNASGKMNLKSKDETYMELIGNLRNSLKILAKKIEPKIYKYGFLRK